MKEVLLKFKMYVFGHDWLFVLIRKEH